MIHLKFNRFSLFLIGLLLAGLVLRILYLYQFLGSPLFSTPIGPDVQEYDTWARQILAGQFLWQKVHIHAPLYPYFLAILYWVFSLDFMLIRFIQQLLALTAIFPLYFMTVKLHGGDEDRPARNMISYLFLCFWVLYPPLAYYQSELISEALLMPLTCLLLYFFYKAEERMQDQGNRRPYLHYFGLAGLCGGLAVITHPTFLLFVGFECAYLTWRWYRGTNLRPTLAKALALFLALAMLPVLPVCIYNSYISGKPVAIQANGGFNFFLGTNFNADGTCYLRPGPEWDSVHNVAEEEAEKQDTTTDAYFISQSLTFVKDHPLNYVSLFLRKVFFVWNYRELTAGADVEPLRYFTLIQKHTWWSFGVLASLALSGLILGIRKPAFRRKYRHFLILLLAYWIVQSIFVTSGRYRLVMLPSFCIFAAYGVSVIISNIRHHHKMGKLYLVGIASVAIVFAPITPENPERERAEADTTLGEAYLLNGQVDAAEVYLKRAMLPLREWSRSYDLYGKVLLTQGVLQGAQIMFMQSIHCNPDSPYGYMNLGVVHSNLQNNESARYYFEEALKRDPSCADAYYNYGIFLMRTDKGEALQKLEQCLQLSPGHRPALNAVGIYWMMQKKPLEAVRYFLKALRQDPRNVRIMLNISVARLQAGDLLGAQQYLDMARRISPQLPQLDALQSEINSQKR